MREVGGGADRRARPVSEEERAADGCWCAAGPRGLGRQAGKEEKASRGGSWAARKERPAGRMRGRGGMEGIFFFFFL